MSKYSFKNKTNVALDILIYCFLVDGEKGGIGKSTYAMLLLQWMLDNNRQVIGFDCDRSNQTLADHYSNATPISNAFFSEDPSQAWQADHMLDAAVKKQANIVADLPAQTHRPQKNYLFNGGGFKTAERYNVKFVKFFLCCDWYSADQFVDSFKTFYPQMPHILVLNQGLCDNFSFLDDHKDFQELSKEYKFPIIQMDKLTYREHQFIESLRLTYAEAIELDDLTLAGQQRVVDFLVNCYEQLDKLQLFDNEQ